LALHVLDWVIKVEKRHHTRKNGDDIPILRPVVALHDQLMSSCHQSQAIVVVECLRDILPKCVTGATRRDAPSTSIVRVRPEEVAHGTFMGNLLYAIQSTDVVKSVYTWRQASVKAEYLVINESRERQVIKQVREVLPDVRIAVLSQALIVEAIDLGDLARFVVPSEDGNALRVSDLKGNKEGYSLDRKIATIDIIA
jgi:hypothetical protein